MTKLFGRFSTLTIVAPICGAVIVGCAPPAPLDVVRVGTDVDAETLDPRLMRNTTDYRVVNLLYDGLVVLDEGFSPLPNAALSWEQETPTTWVFHLRDSLFFHDGSRLTAEDVVYTFETILDPELRSPSRMLYSPIESIEAVDELTVRFELSEPYAPFLRYLDVGIVPKQLVESGHNLSVAPVGSGPYVLDQWDRGNRIALHANEVHWAGRPSIPQIDVLLVPDNTARTQAFEAGDLDLIQSPLGPQDVLRLSEYDRFVKHVQLGNSITYLNFNTTVPILSDPLMRRALASLIDRNTIVDRIYENIDSEATSIFPPTSWAYSEEAEQPYYDPDGADILLDELGWRDTNGDGFREKDGQTLRVRLGTHSEDVNRVQTVELLQNSFTQHGIEVNLEISDWASFAVRRDAGDFDIILLGWTQLVDPDRVTFEQLHSTGGLNWGGYRNARLDVLLDRGRAAQEQAARAVAYKKAAVIIANEVPYYVLSHQGYQLFHSPRILGFEADPRGMLRSLTKSSLEN